MTTPPDRQISAMEGDTALPRRNGELVFEAPWEGRAFGIAVALNESGLYRWPEFQSRLASKTAGAERGGEASTYYERWLASLERLLVEKDLLTPEELEIRTLEYASGQRDDDWHD